MMNSIENNWISMLAMLGQKSNVLVKYKKQ